MMFPNTARTALELAMTKTHDKGMVNSSSMQTAIETKSNEIKTKNRNATLGLIALALFI